MSASGVLIRRTPSGKMLERAAVMCAVPLQSTGGWSTTAPHLFSRMVCNHHPDCLCRDEPVTRRVPTGQRRAGNQSVSITQHGIARIERCDDTKRRRRPPPPRLGLVTRLPWQDRSQCRRQPALLLRLPSGRRRIRPGDVVVRPGRRLFSWIAEPRWKRLLLHRGRPASLRRPRRRRHFRGGTRAPVTKAPPRDSRFGSPLQLSKVHQDQREDEPARRVVRPVPHPLRRVEV